MRSLTEYVGDAGRFDEPGHDQDRQYWRVDTGACAWPDVGPHLHQPRHSLLERQQALCAFEQIALTRGTNRYVAVLVVDAMLA
jgi:hypothetical protein